MFHTLSRKWSFPLGISSVNVTRSAGNCEFGHFYWRNPKCKISFFVQRMRHQIIPMLQEDKSGTVVTYIGINDKLNRCNRDLIIKNIQQIYITCKNSNVNLIIIFGIISCKRADDSVKYYPANIFLFKDTIINTRKRCEICSKSTIKTSERRFYC